MRPLRFPFFILITLSAGAAGAVEREDDTDNFREDVFACEEAVAHLASCCPDFIATNARCVYDHHSTDGCDSYTKIHEDPAISLTEAECVLDMDCGTIRQRGICERAAAMRPERSSTRHEVGHDEPSKTEGNVDPVCP
jgi:hypothetical protein